MIVAQVDIYSGVGVSALPNIISQDRPASCQSPKPWFLAALDNSHASDSHSVQSTSPSQDEFASSQSPKPSAMTNNYLSVQHQSYFSGTKQECSGSLRSKHSLSVVSQCCDFSESSQFFLASIEQNGSASHQLASSASTTTQVENEPTHNGKQDECASHRPAESSFIVNQFVNEPPPIKNNQSVACGDIRPVPSSTEENTSMPPFPTEALPLSALPKEHVQSHTEQHTGPSTLGSHSLVGEVLVASFTSNGQHILSYQSHSPMIIKIF